MRTIFVLATILSSLCLAAFAQDLETVRNSIVEQGAAWEAAENPISTLPDDILRQMMGTLLPPLDFTKHDPGTPSEVLPRLWDWRDALESNWVTPVRDQGGCGSCWAFGSIAQLESAIMIVAEDPTRQSDLSEQYMVSCDKSNYGCSGGYMSNAYTFLKTTGVPTEECFPYEAQDLACERSCKSPMLFKIKDWHAVTNSVADLQEAVYEQPVTCAFYVFRDFTYYKGGVYKHVSGDLLGGHAVCVVGWSVDDGCFIVKNSWGEWGEEGYFRIAFSEMGTSVRFGIQAGKFDVESPSLMEIGTLVTLWGGLK